ncbi:MAG: DNA gyrase inhibitor YacG [Nitrospirota bacterium]
MKCPVCKKETEWEGNTFRPFCSERCKIIDLGTWADEGYRIAAGDNDDDNYPGENCADEEAGEG